MPQRSNSARDVWGERNALDVSIAYNAGGVAPHGATVRATYTVPTARKAAVQNVSSRVRITTVATTPGIRDAYVYYVISAVNYYIVMPMLGNQDNLVSNHSEGYVGVGSVLPVGSAVSIATYDGSTGGQCEYNISVKMTEYDV